MGHRRVGRRSASWRRIGVAGAVIAALALGACGSSDDGTASSATTASGATAVKVGYPLLSDSAPLLLGIEKGFFRRQGLDVEAVEQPAAATIIPSLVKHQVDLNAYPPLGVIAAAQKGLPLRIVGGLTQYGSPSGKPAGAIFIVKPGSEIRSFKDLEGKKIGVNGLRTASEFGVLEAVRRAGGDPSKVQVIEIPFTAMGDAVSSGRIDGALAADPVAAQLAASGKFDTSLGDPLADVLKGAPRVVIQTTKDYAARNPQVIERFRRALDESMTYASGHEDELRQVVSEKLGTPEELARQMRFPTLDAQVTPAGVDRLSEFLTEWKMIPKPVPADEVLLP